MTQKPDDQPFIIAVTYLTWYSQEGIVRRSVFPSGHPKTYLPTSVLVNMLEI